MRFLAILVLLISSHALSGAAINKDEVQTTIQQDPFAQIHGMTISCHGSGQSWGSDAMVESMAKLKEMGVNWIAIHPYAGINPNGTVGGSRRRNRMYHDASAKGVRLVRDPTGKAKDLVEFNLREKVINALFGKNVVFIRQNSNGYPLAV